MVGGYLAIMRSKRGEGLKPKAHFCSQEGGGAGVWKGAKGAVHGWFHEAFLPVIFFIFTPFGLIS